MCQFNLVTDKGLNWHCVGLSTGNAYPSGHLVQSLLGLAYAPVVETSFLELAMISRLFTLNIPRYSLDFAKYNDANLNRELKYNSIAIYYNHLKTSKI